jgi:hypothetical protein
MKALVVVFLLASACASNRLPKVNAPADGAEYYLPNQPTHALQSRILPDPHGGLGHSQDPDIRVTDIRLTATYTVVYLTYGKDKSDRYFNYAGTSSISFNPKAVLASSDGKRTFALLKTEGIPMSPQTTEIKNDEKLSFTLYFERLDKGIEAFDLFECNSDTENSCFNVAGITIENPADSGVQLPK